MRSPCIVTVALTCVLFFFNDTATTEIYTLSLHDALPISRPPCLNGHPARHARRPLDLDPDRKSTRLNSSHTLISYAVFCLKKKRNKPSAPRGPRASRARPPAGGRADRRDLPVYTHLSSSSPPCDVAQPLFFCFFLSMGPPPDSPPLPPPAPLRS